MLGWLKDDLRGVARAGLGRVAALALVVADDVARRTATSALARRVGDLNTRLAAMEPHGPAVGICQVCGGGLHLIASDIAINAGGVHVKRTLLRCARCWCLRPIDRPDTGGDAGVIS